MKHDKQRETTSNNIPSYDLIHDDKKVSFALRTMEEIDKRQKGNPDPPHRHNYFTILWAKKACGEHYIDFQEYLIEPDVIFFVSPGQVHHVVTYPNPEGYVLMFTCDFLFRNHIPESFIHDMGLFSEFSSAPPIKINKQAREKLGELAKKIQETFSSDEEYKDEIIGAYLKLFLIECNKFAPKAETENTQTFQTGKTLLRDFKRLVENNLQNWHKVSDYASELHVSADYLNSVVKNLVGKTAKELIQNRIILEAKRLGIHTQLSTKEIAYRLGFEDPSHFSKFFKNVDNNSFSDFRTSVEKTAAA